jgi:hypothetical protein
MIRLEINQPSLKLLVPTRLLKKKPLWFSGDRYNPDDNDFNRN